MKNTTILTMIVAVIVIAGLFVFLSEKLTTGKVISKNSELLVGQTQQVVLSEKGFNYQDVVIESGRPVILSADNSVTGCARSVVFNLEGKTYSKYLQTPEDSLTLPSLEKGTYTFSCAMRMVSGKLIVK